MLSQADLNTIAYRNQKLKQLKAGWGDFAQSVPVPVAEVPTDDIEKLLEEIGNLKFTILLMTEMNRKRLPLYEMHSGLGDK